MSRSTSAGCSGKSRLAPESAPQAAVASEGFRSDLAGMKTLTTLTRRTRMQLASPPGLPERPTPASRRSVNSPCVPSTRRFLACPEKIQSGKTADYPALRRNSSESANRPRDNRPFGRLVLCGGRTWLLKRSDWSSRWVNIHLNLKYISGWWVNVSSPSVGSSYLDGKKSVISKSCIWNLSVVIWESGQFTS